MMRIDRVYAKAAMAMGLLLYLSVTGQAENLTVLPGETVGLNQIRVYGEVNVQRDGLIELEMLGSSGELYIKSGFLEITANAIRMASGSEIRASRKGFGVAVPSPTENSGGQGGSHGGHGGAPVPEERWPIQGNENLPDVMRGVHGADGPAHTNVGGPGGGALTLRADDMMIDGEVDCNGWTGENWRTAPGYNPPSNSPYHFGGGGGSGGGILIIARHLTIGPNARITANGGDGGRGWVDDSCYYGYPGGGGRIKIFYEEGTISESAIIEALGGVAPTPVEHCGGNGGVEDGTVHIQQVKSVDQLLNPGDINGDGKTDYEDLLMLMDSWQREVTPIPTTAESE